MTEAEIEKAKKEIVIIMLGSRNPEDWPTNVVAIKNKLGGKFPNWFDAFWEKEITEKGVGAEVNKRWIREGKIKEETNGK